MNQSSQPLRRILFALLCAVHPASAAVENFVSGVGNFSNASGNTEEGSTFGFSATDFTGGVDPGGEIGGFFSRTSLFRFVADTALGEGFTRTGTFSGSGEAIVVANNGFDGNIKIGYFNSAAPGTEFVGLNISEPGSGSGSSMRVSLGISTGTGTDFATPFVAIPVGTAFTFDFTYYGRADGSGVIAGTINGQVRVGVLPASPEAAFDAFGVGAGYTSSSDPNSVAEFYADALNYQRSTDPVPSSPFGRNRRTEEFISGPGGFAFVNGNLTDGNTIEFSATDTTAGVSSAGEVGGLFARSSGFHTLGDNQLGGTLTRADSLYLAGEAIILESLSFDGVILAGFHNSNPDAQEYIGLILNEPSTPGGPFRARLLARNAAGQDTQTTSIINVPALTPFTFDLQFFAKPDGSGILHGIVNGQTRTLVLGGDGDSQFDVFGVGAGLLAEGTGNPASQAVVYFDQLTYTTRSFPPPSVLEITGIALETNGFRISLRGATAGKSYDIFRSTTLSGWTPLNLPQLAPENGIISFIDPEANGAVPPAWFYQIWDVTP